MNVIPTRPSELLPRVRIAPPYFVIRNRGGRYWQATKGFLSHDLVDATKYSTRADAEGAAGFMSREPTTVEEITK